MTHDLNDIRQRALRLMDDLGRAHLGRSLQEAGWAFRFDRAKRRLGACRWTPGGNNKTLSLSRHYCASAGWAVMEDVARHEIAHALDVETRGRSDHGPAWKTWAVACGADPTRLYEGDAVDAVDAAMSRYVGRCPQCGGEQAFYRKPKRHYACRACCDRHQGGRYTDRFRLVLYDRRSGRAVAPNQQAARPIANGRARRTATHSNAAPDQQAAPKKKYTGTCPRCGTRTHFARRLTRAYACAACCAQYAGGRFDARFALVIRQNY